MLSLFELIQSLSKSEKRYFKLHANTFGTEERVYIQLFDAIDEQESYDESAIANEFGIKHFSPYKKYLYESILKSMRAFHGEQNGSLQVMNAFQNILLLRNKGLMKDAIKLYEKTKQSLLEMHLYSLLVELMTTGGALYARYLPRKEVPAKLDEIYREKLRYYDYGMNITEYHALSRKVREVWRRVYPIRSEEQEYEIRELLTHPLLIGPHKAMTSVAKAVYHECISLCYGILLNWKGIIQNSQEALDSLNQHPQDSLKHHKKRIFQLHHLLIGASKLKDEKLFNEYLSQFEDMNKRLKASYNIAFDALMQKLYYVSVMSFYIEMEQFEEAIARKEEIMEFITAYEKYLPTDFSSTMKFYFAIAYFHLHDYEQTIDWLQPIMDEEKNHPKKASVCSARILNLMAHYEMEHYLLISSLVRSTQRYLNKNESIFQSERLLLNFFKWLSSNYNADNIDQKFKKLCDKLVEHGQNKYERNFFDDIKLQIWLDEKQKQIINC